MLEPVQGARRRWWLAGLLSLLAPGMGHLYNGQARRALLFLALTWLIGLASLGILWGFSWAPLNIVIGRLLGPLLHLYIIIDSMVTAKHLDGVYPWKVYNQWPVYLAGVVLFWLLSVGIIFLLKTNLIEFLRVPSAGMADTIQGGDELITNKLIYGVRNPITGRFLIPFRDPQRGEVVLFRFPQDRSVLYVKRIVGLPGERVMIRLGKMFLNDQPYEEPYVKSTDTNTFRVPDHFGPVLVPPGQFFVLVQHGRNPVPVMGSRWKVQGSRDPDLSTFNFQPSTGRWAYRLQTFAQQY